ncbi:MAG: bacteriorhodopsin [Jatrophihabitans sp.]|uniref:bacteriorhodopsin n=1 Tax=Jatrophihabitans sp. TaxID=1932789 RepID=UPI003F817D52
MIGARLVAAGVQGPTTELTGTSSLDRWQWELILFALVVGFFALFASGVFSLSTKGEVSKKYRPASLAGALISFVAALAYVLLIGVFLTHWHSNADGTRYIPQPGTALTGLRYADWTVTVPLLTVELLAVCNMARGKIIGWRFACMASAFLMIVTGFLGVVAVGQHDANVAELVVWGLISTVFFVALYPLLLVPVMRTRKEISAEAGTSLRNAATLLLSVWGVYPIVYLIPWWAGDHSAGWAVTIQISFTAADIAAKAGFGALIHKVAKLRTAEDTATEVDEARVPDVYPSEVYISGNLYSLPPIDGSELAGVGGVRPATGNRSSAKHPNDGPRTER